MSAPKTYEHCGYLRELVRTEELRKSVAKVVRALRKLQKDGVEFDTLAFRGNSGALISVPVALRLRKEMILVRKDENDCHSSYAIEGHKACKRYIIVDDLICSGKTMAHIYWGIKNKFAPDAEWVGSYTLDDGFEKAFDVERLDSLKLRIQRPIKKEEKD